MPARSVSRASAATAVTAAMASLSVTTASIVL